MPVTSYSTLTDIKDELVNLDFGTNSNLTDQRLGRIRAKIKGEIDSALAMGGYNLPPTITTTTTTADAEVASTDTEVITFTSATGFSVGDSVRIYGLLTAAYNDEFTEIVVISSNNVTVFALGSAFDAGATIDLIDALGFLQLRNIESKGTAARALSSVDIRAAVNQKVIDMQESYDKKIEKLGEGKMFMHGFTQTEGDFVETFASNNTDDAGVTQEPVITISGDIF